MQLPLPTNRLVALTLAGAVLTAVVAVGLASPSLFGADTAGATGSDAPPGASAQLPPDAPTPNTQFTPAVQTPSGEHEEYEGYEEDGEDDELEEDERDED